MPLPKLGIFLSFHSRFEEIALQETKIKKKEKNFNELEVSIYEETKTNT